MPTPPRFSPPSGGWTRAEDKLQDQFLNNAVLQIYGDPQGLGCLFLADRGRWSGLDNLHERAVGFVGSTFGRMGPGPQYGDLFITREIIETALRDMPLNYKQALLHQLIGNFIDLREPWIHRPEDRETKILIYGLTDSQKQMIGNAMQRFAQFMQQQIEARKYVDPQEVVQKINELKEEAISRMELFGTSYR